MSTPDRKTKIVTDLVAEATVTRNTQIDILSSDSNAEIKSLELNINNEFKSRTEQLKADYAARIAEMDAKLVVDLEKLDKEKKIEMKERETTIINKKNSKIIDINNAAIACLDEARDIARNLNVDETIVPKELSIYINITTQIRNDEILAADIVKKNIEELKEKTMQIKEDEVVAKKLDESEKKIPFIPVAKKNKMVRVKLANDKKTPLTWNKFFIQEENVENKPISDENKDTDITCKVCTKVFVFTSQEKEFFMEKRLIIPTKCKECRDKKKQENKDNIDKARTLFQDISLKCLKCNHYFPFSVRDQMTHAKYKLPRPSTCKLCVNTITI
jgi:hypothetical protein